MSSHIDYLTREQVFKETLPWGGVIASPGLQQIGVPEHPNEEQIKALFAGLRPDGAKALRSSATTKVHHFIQSFDESISHNFATKSPEKMALEMEQSAKILKGAYAFYLENCLGNVRRGAGGNEKEKAKLAWLAYPHATNDLGEPHKHFHFVLFEYGVTEKGETRSLANRDKIWTALKKGELIRQTLEAERIELRDGHSVEIVNGRAVIPELKYMGLTGGRARQIDRYLEEHNIERTKASEQIAKARTRKPSEERQAVSKEELHARWSQKLLEQPEVLKDRPSKASTKWTAIAKETAEVLLATANVFWTSTRYAYQKKGRTFLVGDVERFLKDTQKGSLKESHKAAARAVAKNGPASIDEALTIAEQAFRDHRNPKVKLRRGDKVILSEQSLDYLTEEQRDKLRELSRRKGLTIDGFSQGQGY